MTPTPLISYVQVRNKGNTGGYLLNPHFVKALKDKDAWPIQGKSGPYLTEQEWEQQS